MKSQTSTSVNASQRKIQNKDTDFKSQLKCFFQYLQDHIATASMVSIETGIPHKNICRYKRRLQLTNRLWEIEKKLCKQTGFRAWYLSTNPEIKPETNQLTIFE